MYCPDTLALNVLTDANWIEVLVPAPVALADGVAQHLVRSVEAARHGVEVRKGSVVFWVAESAAEETLACTRRAVAELADSGWRVDPALVRAGAEAPEENWRDAWKKHFHVTRLTRSFVVVPSWEDYSAQPGDVLLHLDPGQAFGTGAHASTQLVLEELEALSDESGSFARILDVGTGSGILAIAAAKRWPSAAVLATDVDELALRAATENCEKNGVAERVRVSLDPLAKVEGSFPLVLANIQAHVLRPMRDELIQILEPGGHLVLSGILSSQIDALCSWYCESGELSDVKLRRSELDPEWSSAHLVRSPPSL